MQKKNINLLSPYDSLDKLHTVEIRGLGLVGMLLQDEKTQNGEVAIEDEAVRIEEDLKIIYFTIGAF